MTTPSSTNKKKPSHAWLLLYFALYIPWFGWLNSFTPQRTQATEIYCKLDSLIPFLEIFAIPYFLWFAYIAFGFLFLFLNSRTDFIRMCIFLYTGMTICLIIYTLFPNYQTLRIDFDTLGRKNLLTWAMSALQAQDTPYNVFPSIHCLNSIGMNIALAKNAWCKRHRWVIAAATVLTVLICLSTVFVKQHSVLDGLAALILSVPLYLLAYRVPWKRIS